MATLPNVINAIHALNPSAMCIVPRNDIDRIIWTEGTAPISKSDIEAKLAELQTAWDAENYKRDRTRKVQEGGINTYPSIEDQLDMMWHDKKDDTTTWQDAIQAVKDAHAKP